MQFNNAKPPLSSAYNLPLITAWRSRNFNIYCMPTNPPHLIYILIYMPIDAECGINMDRNQLHLSRAEMSKDLWVPHLMANTKLLEVNYTNPTRANWTQHMTWWLAILTTASGCLTSPILILICCCDFIVFVCVCVATLGKHGAISWIIEHVSMSHCCRGRLFLWEFSRGVN